MGGILQTFCLTPTGMRPEGFALLGEYVNGQTYRGPLTWVIVDDCDPATRLPATRDGISVEYVRPSWRWRPGMNTQATSMSAGLARVPDDAALLVLEDDDLYLPGHIANVLDALAEAELVGERISRYYNVATGRYARLSGSRHASLAGAGIRGDGLVAFRAICGSLRTRIDVGLWRGFLGVKRLLDTGNVVGIKGLPGRVGIGVGHGRGFGMQDDGAVLREWVGDLADNYTIFREAA